jgi:hypothetical protein
MTTWTIIYCILIIIIGIQTIVIWRKADKALKEKDYLLATTYLIQVLIYIVILKI